MSIEHPVSSITHRASRIHWAWIVLAIFVSLFSAVDAWVSAHLWDFEGEITPPDDGSAGVQFRYNVPVEGP